MLKLAIAATVAGLFTITPAFAAEMMECNKESMMKVQEMIDADTDPAMMKQVEMAKAEVMKADEAKNANKMEDCATHLNKAAMELKAQ